MWLILQNYFSRLPYCIHILQRREKKWMGFLIGEQLFAFTVFAICFCFIHSFFIVFFFLLPTILCKMCVFEMLKQSNQHTSLLHNNSYNSTSFFSFLQFTYMLCILSLAVKFFHIWRWWWWHVNCLLYFISYHLTNGTHSNANCFTSLHLRAFIFFSHSQYAYKFYILNMTIKTHLKKKLKQNEQKQNGK